MKLTTSQTDAITHRGSHLLLAASAGSGKTEVLARRVVDLIADARRPCEVGRLLVVTFTRAAAAELRVRIGRMLREAAAACDDTGLRGHLRRQELLIASADICTIDAWCGRLVREHFGEAGVDPAFNVLGAEEARLLRVSIRRRLLEIVQRPPRPDMDETARTPAEQDDAALASEVVGWLARHRMPDEAFLLEMVEQLSGFREQLVNPRDWLTVQADRLTGDDAVLRAGAASLLSGALAAECRFQDDQLAALPCTPGGALAAGIEEYRAVLAEWRDRLATAGALQDVLAAIAKFKPSKSPTDAPAGDLATLDEIRKRWLKRRLQERWDSASLARIVSEAPQAAALLRTLLRLEARHATLLANEKRRRAAYEFGDVQRMALDLLGAPASAQTRMPTAIAGALRERYAHVLVDEFQDTSPVQVELLRLVGRHENGAGNSFYVGDLKQSIYGFRQAEPRLFAGLMDAARAQPEQARVRYLSDNFRSHSALLDGLNRLFAALLSRELGGTDFSKEEHLAAGRSEAPNATLDATPRIVVQVIEEEPQRRGEPGQEEAADEHDDLEVEKIEREAALAAVRIRTLIDGGCRIPERQEDGSIALRVARLSDVVILLRSAAVNAGRVATVLRERGIACVTQGRESIFREVVVQDVRAVLALLGNRRRELELAAYLRGPLAGLTPDELLRVRQSLPKGNFAWCVEQYAEAGRDPALQEKLRHALDQLDRWLRLSREESLPAFLRRLLRESGLLLFAQGMPGGAQRVALLRGLERAASAFAATGQRGVAEFVEHIDALAEHDLDPGVAVAAGDDAVRIMTIHASKGLEFPIVFLLNAGAKFNQRSAGRALQADSDIGLGLKFVDYGRRTETTSAAHFIARERVRRRELAEDLRLLYVATTRAREKLYIAGHAPAGRWAAMQLQHGPAESPAASGVAAAAIRPPPLITRLTVGNPLEWVLMGVAAGELEWTRSADVPLAAVETTSADADATAVRRTAGSAAPPDAGEAWAAEDDAWLRAARRSILVSEGQSAAGRVACSILPSVLSVSAIKELRLRDADADAGAALEEFFPRLRSPLLDAGDKPDADDLPAAAALGTACHRFLELADLTALDSEALVAAQVADLQAAQSLSSEEAALLPTADIAWFGRSPLGRELAAHAARARRETPFVYAFPIDGGERMIVRGIIDLLFDTDHGLVILDYKTDRVAEPALLAERIRGYSTQLGLYSAAAAAIFGRPVCRAALVFLRGRHIAPVPTAAPDLNALLERIAAGASAARTGDRDGS